MSLVVLETHPVQYHAPVYRAVQKEFGIQVTVIYGSDFSVAGYRDPEFDAEFAWDTDLLSGYSHTFLSRIADGGAGSADEVKGRGMSRALANARPDVVLLPGYSPAFYRRAALTALRHRLPMMLRAETTDHARTRSPAKRLVRDAYLRGIYAGCDAFLYIGERSRRHYERLGIEADDLFFSPYCVDPAPFSTTEADRGVLHNRTRRALNISDGALVLLFSGKLVARKDPSRIIEAVRALGRPFDEVTIIFLGDGGLHGDLASAARIDPPVDVRFIGFRNQGELSAYYHAADMLVLPSRRDETWGLVVNEALLHGVPCVVSTAVGCADDLIEPGETGFTFEPENTEALAVAIAACARMSGTAVRAQCRAVVSDYTIQKAAHGIAGAYHAIKARHT